VPRGLAEEKARKAIADDDAAAQRLAQENLRDERTSSESDCGCAAAALHPLPYGRRLRATYRRIRKFHHPSFSKLLSEHYGATVPWDSPLAIATWRRVTSFNGVVDVWLFRDIVINRNATLLVDAPTRSLWAGNISIHRTGRLVAQGGYLKIWANSINVLHNLSIEATGHAGPWLQRS
jgi:hypothetical protein